MSYLDESEGGDYIVEEVPEGEVVRQDLIILQDRDFELSTPEELVLAIEGYFNDLNQLVKQNALVTEAIKSPNLDRIVPVTMSARLLRDRLEKKYGRNVPRRFVVESASTSSGRILALEEESNEQKGFFIRVIDAIANAFKWLWRKITGLFSSGKSKKDVEKENDKIKEKMEKIEKIPASERVEPKEVAYNDTVKKALAHMGKKVSASAMEKDLEKVPTIGIFIEELYNELLRAYEDMIITIGNIAEDDQGRLKEHASVYRHSTMMSHLTRKIASASNASQVNLAEIGLTTDDEKTAKVMSTEKFVGNNELFIWYYEKEQLVTFGSKLMKYDGDVDSVEPPNFHQLQHMTDLYKRASAVFVGINERLTKKAEALESGSMESRLKSALNNFMPKEVDSLEVVNAKKENVKDVQEFGSMFSKALLPMLAGIRAMQHNVNHYKTVIEATLDVSWTAAKPEAAK